jgi:hypothetical protein
MFINKDIIERYFSGYRLFYYHHTTSHNEYYVIYL